MRLSEFIEANLEAILSNWVAFAQLREGAVGMDRRALRDHALGMLRDIVADLRTPQTLSEEMDKAHGESDATDEGSDSAAQAHGADRAGSGFTISEMVSEFRALRASVLRLWTAQQGTLTGRDLQDLMRFNESIDQTLAESVTRFTQQIDESKDMFIAVLSHELRSPLQTVLMVTEHLQQAPDRDAGQTVLVARATRSVKRMIDLVDDLLDFTRSRMGAGVGITPVPTNVSALVQDAVDEIEAAYPTRAFGVVIEAGLEADVDPARIRQVLANLLANAVQHGDSSLPILVHAHSAAHTFTIEVTNHGRPIPPSEFAGLFSPFKRVQPNTPASADHHLGLGLYITERITAAHGGQITVSSSKNDGTRFRVQLPRHAAS